MFRGAFQAIQKGQIEAQAFGMSRFLVFWRVKWPVVFRLSLAVGIPSLIGAAAGL